MRQELRLVQEAELQWWRRLEGVNRRAYRIYLPSEAINSSAAHGDKLAVSIWRCADSGELCLLINLDRRELREQQGVRP